MRLIEVSSNLATQQYSCILSILYQYSHTLSMWHSVNTHTPYQYTPNLVILTHPVILTQPSNINAVAFYQHSLLYCRYSHSTPFNHHKYTIVIPLPHTLPCQHHSSQCTPSEQTHTPHHPPPLSHPLSHLPSSLIPPPPSLSLSP